MTTLVDGGAIPVGTILAFGGPISAIPDGFLACNGALVNRNDYADLFAVIGTQWGTDSGVDFRVPTCNGNLIRGRANGSGADPDRASRTAVQTGGLTGDNVGSLQTWRVQSHRHRSWLMNTYGTNVGAKTPSSYNGDNRGSNGNTTPNGDVFNKAIIGWATSGGNAYGATSGVACVNGNSNFNDTSPNSPQEFATENFYLQSTNTGSAQTVGRNVYVEFIIKY